MKTSIGQHGVKPWGISTCKCEWNNGMCHLCWTRDRIKISVDSDQWDGISPKDDEGWQTVTSLRDLSLYPNTSQSQSESKPKNNVKKEQ